MPSIKQLPGRIKAIFGMKGILARSLGYSREFNRRNLELMWYPLWSHALHETFRGMSNVLIAPQFPVWLDPAEWPDRNDLDGNEPEQPEDREDFEAGSGVLERPDPPPSEVLDETIGYSRPRESVSALSKGVTAPLRNASSQIIDAAILIVESIPVTQNILRYGGRKIHKMWVPVIVEIKKCPHRHYSAAEMEVKVESYLAQMQKQICTQAAYIFSRFPLMMELMAIAGVGAYWSHAIIRRREYLSGNQLDEIRKRKSKTYKTIYETVDREEWRKPTLLDSSESQKRLKEIKKYVKDFVRSMSADSNLGEPASEDPQDANMSTGVGSSGVPSSPETSGDEDNTDKDHCPTDAKTEKAPRRGRNLKSSITEVMRSSARLKEKRSLEEARVSASAAAGSSTGNTAGSTQVPEDTRKGKQRGGKRAARGRK
ncbi:hypothetical protein CERSUDRAFT_101129 [Gelatoporia subvermispora B]|uniref:Uncharacterized protein n=1 Tax=Ceriporiopsis subvermispora (strain B) TaxID=914234 RepID=M2P5X7_CERS8|nr:hypothetical protein CERSUDRAFT_101129 [Gelatoporia subvermispora B]